MNNDKTQLLTWSVLFLIYSLDLVPVPSLPLCPSLCWPHINEAGLTLPFIWQLTLHTEDSQFFMYNYSKLSVH